MTAIKKKNIALIGIGEIGNCTVEYLQAQSLRNVLLASSDASAPNNMQTVMDHLLSEHPEIVFVVGSLDESAEADKLASLAGMAKAEGILTIGFITMEDVDSDKTKDTYLPLAAIKQHTDATFVLAYDKLRTVNRKLETITARASEYIANALRAIAEVVTLDAEVNVDVDDVRTVLEKADKALVGTATAKGQNRAMVAVQQATDFTLLTHSDIAGAGRILLSITSGATAELEMEELTDITEYIQDKAGQQAEVIFGHSIDDKLEDGIRVTLIAACFSDN